MVRKYERAGTLLSVRENGRALYEAAAVEELRQERDLRKAEREDAAQSREANSSLDDLERWQSEDALWEHQLFQRRERQERERQSHELERLRARHERLEHRVRMLSIVRQRRTRPVFPRSPGSGGAMGVVVPLLLTAGVAFLAGRASEKASKVKAGDPQSANLEASENPRDAAGAMLETPLAADEG